MREVVLDTETTGFDHRGNDRIVEIGCIELLNSVPTGKSYQRYINPERDMVPLLFTVYQRRFLLNIQSSKLLLMNSWISSTTRN